MRQEDEGSGERVCRLEVGGGEVDGKAWAVARVLKAQVGEEGTPRRNGAEEEEEMTQTAARERWSRQEEEASGERVFSRRWKCRRQGLGRCPRPHPHVTLEGEEARSGA